MLLQAVNFTGYHLIRRTLSYGLPQDGVGATHGKFDIFRLLIVNFPPLGWQTKRYSEHWVKMPVILIICEWEIYPPACVCELESSMSPKQREIICWWKKTSLAKLCKCAKKLTSSPVCFCVWFFDLLFYQKLVAGQRPVKTCKLK